MSNSYYKLLNLSSNQKCKEDIINNIHQELNNFAKLKSFNIYDEINSPKKGEANDVNLLLKCYILNHIKQELSNIENAKESLQDTANNNIKKDSSNNYCRLTNGVYTPDETIKGVFSDGSYVVEKLMNQYSKYKIRKIFNANDKIVKIQLINPAGKVESNLTCVLEILGMRKEFVQKYKYSGYSGNSNDFVAALLNQFNSPVATGYYMDKHYNLYKWDTKNSCFIHNPDKDVQSPLLTDYSFIKAKEVIRKEYTGV